MATTSAAQLDKLLKGTDLAQQQQASLEAIRQEIADLIKKGDKLSKEDEKRIDALKDEIVALHKVASIERRKEIASIIKEFKLSLESIKDDWVEYSDNIKLSYLNLENQFQDTMKETQVLMEEKLTQIGELVGTKISIAAEFVGTKVKTVITGALNAMEKRINTVFSNLGGSIKSGFSKLKSVIMNPIEFIKSLPGKILGFVKSGLMLVYNLTKSLLRFTYNVIIGAIRLALVSIVKIFKGIVWVVSKIFQGIYWVVKQAFSFIYKSFVKIFSFITGVLWSAIKTIGSFVLNVMWTTIKTIASTVVKVAYTIAKTLVQTIVTAVLAAFSPWLGLLALVGVGIYFLGRYFGWWGGGADTKPGAPEKGGFFSGIWDAFIAKADEWWGAVSKYFWDGNGNGIIEKAVYSLWNPGSGEPGYIQKFFGITGDFFSSMWNKLLEFGKWLFYGPQKKTLTDTYKSLNDTKKEEFSNLLNDFSQSKAAPLKQGFAGLIPVISEWWETSGAKTVSDFISKWWVVAWNSIKEQIVVISSSLSEYIYGKGQGWANPSSDSLLGKIYTVIFGKNSIDFGSNLGFIGKMKDLITFDVINPITDIIATKVIPAIDNLMGVMGNFIEAYVPGGKAINKGIASARGAMMSSAQGMRQEVSAVENKRKEEILNRYQVVGYDNLSKHELAMLKYLDSRPSVSKITEDQLNGIKSNFNFLAKYVLGKVVADNPNVNSQPAVIQAIIRNMKETYGPLLQTDNLPWYLTETMHSGKAIGLGKEVVTDILKNQDTFTKNMGIFKNDANILKSGGFDDALTNKYSNMIDRLSGWETSLKSSYDNWANDASKKDALYKAAISSDPVSFYADDVVKRGFLALLGQVSQEARGLVTGGYSDIGTGKEIAKDSDNYLGLAMGGIIKPPNTKADMGRIITVAEAGDPEVVLPLNAEGIKYIKDISEALQPEKENNDMFNSLKELIEGKKVEDSTPVKTRQFNPQLPAMNIRGSDSTQLDILKLVSLGVLSK